MINEKTVEDLITIYIEDKEMLNIIYDALNSFEDYHSAIFTMETKTRLYPVGSMDAEERRIMVEGLDKRRTNLHNKIISSVNILNRIAKIAGLLPFYDGIVSEERPYRSEVANYVLEYVEKTVRERR